MICAILLLVGQLRLSSKKICDVRVVIVKKIIRIILMSVIVSAIRRDKGFRRVDVELERDLLGVIEEVSCHRSQGGTGALHVEFVL